MKKNLCLALALALIAMLAFGCGSSGGKTEEPTDGDTDTADNDTNDTTSEVDGDPDTTESESDADSVLDCSSDRCACDTAADCVSEFPGCSPIGVCRKPECTTATECTAAPLSYDASYVSCNAEGFCAQAPCKSNADCTTAGMNCSGGVCKIAAVCDTGSTLVIAPGSGLINEASTLTLTATVYNKNGVVVSGQAITWSSDATSSVAVAQTGVITGGSVSGSAVITAAVTGCATGTATYINYAEITTGSRVVLKDSATGEAISDATVYLVASTVTDLGTELAVKTDATGAALFTTACTEAATCTLHIFHASYNYVSVFGLGVSDILVPLNPNTDLTIAAGTKGRQDLSSIPAGLKKDTQLGISMFSIPGSLADLNFTSLIGDMIKTHVQIGTSINTTLPLPSGLEGYIKDKPLKDGYYAVAVPGKATLWGLGGYAKLSVLLDKIGSNISTPINVGKLITAALPFFNEFYHGVATGYEFGKCAKIIDVNDSDSDSDKTNLISNLADCFSEENLPVDQALTQNVGPVTYGTLPTTAGGAKADTAITLVGAMQTGVGFVPLGFTAGADSNSDGTIDGTVAVSYAPQHGGLIGFPYYTLNVAVPVAGLLKKASKSIDISGSISRSNEAPSGAYTAPNFLGFVANGGLTDDGTEITVTGSAVTNATFYRVVLSKDIKDTAIIQHTIGTTYWHIYWASTAPSFKLPVGLTDDRAADLGASSMVQAIQLGTGTYDGLFGFGDTNIANLNSLITSFSMHIL
jgi:hypothetical protein